MSADLIGQPTPGASRLRFPFGASADYLMDCFDLVAPVPTREEHTTFGQDLTVRTKTC